MNQPRTSRGAQPAAQQPAFFHFAGPTKPLCTKDELPCAEALISAVAHRELCERPLAQVRDKIAPAGCFIDLKSQFDEATLRESGLSVWRL